jgi:thiol-disulfide isomerase/thioredoxin
MVNENKRISAIFHLAAFVAAYAGFTAQLPAQVVAGSYFPPLGLMELSGGKVPVTRGSVVIVDSWASWCAPCKASFPAYSHLQSDFAGRGVAIVAVGLDDSDSAYGAFVERLKPTFVTLHDSGKTPVRFVHPGFRGDQTERELRSEIEILLNEEATTL